MARTTAETTQAAEETPLVYQLKISIAGSRPLIWRRVLIPARRTLAELHLVIQSLMGWEDDHLHEFEVPGPGDANLKTLRSRRTSLRISPKTDPYGEPLDDLFGDSFDHGDGGRRDEATITLEKIAPAVKAHFLYTYDMGDNWEHDIVVEKISPADPKGAYPICVTGKRNGPIEDCGGIWGYEEMLMILADPKHEEHNDRKEWLKEAYGVRTWDGEAFDLEGINKKLKKQQPKPKQSTRPPS